MDLIRLYFSKYKNPSVSSETVKAKTIIISLKYVFSVLKGMIVLLTFSFVVMLDTKRDRNIVRYEA